MTYHDRTPRKSQKSDPVGEVGLVLDGCHDHNSLNFCAARYHKITNYRKMSNSDIKTKRGREACQEPMSCVVYGHEIGNRTFVAASGRASEAQDACKNGPSPCGENHQNQTWNDAQSKAGAAGKYAYD